MSDFKSRLRQALERAIISSDVQNGDDIEAVLKAFRTLANRQIEATRAKNPELASRAKRMVDETILEFRMNVLPKPDATNPNSGYSEASGDDAYSMQTGADAEQRARMPAVPFLAGALSTLCVVILVTFLAARFGYISQNAVFTADGEGPLAIPSDDVIAANVVIPEITETVLEAQARLERDPAGVHVESPDQFYQFRDVFSDLYQSMSTQARAGLGGFMVRRDEGSYKIMLTGRICPVITQLGILKRDAVREQGYSVICHFYGVWNEGGEKF